MKKKLNKKGFTLVELIVVIAILAILAAILVPTISGVVQKAKTTAAESNVRAVYNMALSAWTSLQTTNDTVTADQVEAAMPEYLGANYKENYEVTLGADNKIESVKYGYYLYTVSTDAVTKETTTAAPQTTPAATATAAAQP